MPFQCFWSEGLFKQSRNLFITQQLLETPSRHSELAPYSHLTLMFSDRTTKYTSPSQISTSFWRYPSSNHSSPQTLSIVAQTHQGICRPLLETWPLPLTWAGRLPVVNKFRWLPTLELENGHLGDMVQRKWGRRVKSRPEPRPGTTDTRTTTHRTPYYHVVLLHNTRKPTAHAQCRLPHKTLVTDTRVRYAIAIDVRIIFFYLYGAAWAELTVIIIIYYETFWVHS